MATNQPVILNASFQNVQDGEWSGAVQNVGNTPLVGVVADAEDGQPSETEGGFAIYSQPIPINIGVSETLWVRAVGDIGAVVLG
jgi:hypothetical protein